MRRTGAHSLRRAVLTALASLSLTGCPGDPSPAAIASPAIAAATPVVERGTASSAADMATLGRAVCALTMQETEGDLEALFGAPPVVNRPNPDIRDIVYRNDAGIKVGAVFAQGALVDVMASRVYDEPTRGDLEVASQVVIETHSFAAGKTTRDDVDRVLGPGKGVLFRRTSGRPSREQLEAARMKRPDLTIEQLEALFSSCLEKRRYPFGNGGFTVLTFSGDTLFQ